MSNCVDIEIVDDSIVESNEEFSLVISTSEERVNLSPESAVIVITDNDCKCYSISIIIWRKYKFLPISVVTVSFEGDEMIQFIREDLSPKQICVVLSHTDLERDIVVTVSTEEGTASGNVGIEQLALMHNTVFFFFRNSRLCPNCCSKSSIYGRHRQNVLSSYDCERQHSGKY